ncbi:MAG: pseudouridine-5'-phosphate glycosidase, partial [Pseudomonadota bacterium]
MALTKTTELPDFLEISEEVYSALSDGKPIVALESTIVTHGMPFPDNFQMAKSVEDLIREKHVVPATVAVINGRLKVGLSLSELDELAQSKNPLKISRADMAYAIAARKTAGTTVAATMMAAKLVGIEVFATGGIGGVHKGAETSFDISADLYELGKTNVIVVAAGAKAILDVPKTLEVLETQGVPVIGYKTDSLPAFWSSGSDIDVPLRMDSAADIAHFHLTRLELGDTSGILVANPIPASDEIPAEIINRYIVQAQTEMEDK